MPEVDLQEAQAHLPELTDDAARGEDVIITRDDGATFSLTQIAGRNRRGALDRGMGDRDREPSGKLRLRYQADRDGRSDLSGGSQHHPVLGRRQLLLRNDPNRRFDQPWQFGRSGHPAP